MLKNVYDEKSHKHVQLQNINFWKKSGKLFGFIQCTIEVFHHLKPHSATFLPLFKNTVVNRKGIKKLTRRYTEEEGFMSQSQKKFFSSFTLQNRTLINPPFFEDWSRFSKNDCFVENTPKNCLNSFVPKCRCKEIKSLESKFRCSL